MTSDPPYTEIGNPSERVLLSKALKVLTPRQIYDLACAVEEVQRQGYGTVRISIQQKSDCLMMEVTVRTKLLRS